MLTLGAGLCACGRTADSERYFPLAPGFAWHYRIERTTMDGTTELRHAVATRAVPERLAASGMRETLAGQRYLYHVTPEGVFRTAGAAAGGAPDAVEPAMVLPATLTPTRTWRVHSHTSVLENTGPPWESLFRMTVPIALEYRVESLTATVDTPAGRFEHCLLLSGRGTTHTETDSYLGRTRIAIALLEWYAPGVGLVRMERDETTDAAALARGRLVMELEHWNAP